MPMTPQEMLNLLKHNGFEVTSQNGSHIKLRNPQTNRTVIVPYHSKDLKKRFRTSNTKTGRFKIIITFIGGV